MNKGSGLLLVCLFASAVFAASGFPARGETIFKNVGNYDFREILNYKKDFGLMPQFLETFDVDGDGNDDLIFGFYVQDIKSELNIENEYTKPVVFFWNESEQKFQPREKFQEQLPKLYYPRRVTGYRDSNTGKSFLFFADTGLDGKHRPNCGANNLLVVYDPKSGKLEYRAPHPVNDYSHGLASVDINSDGLLDHLVLNSPHINWGSCGKSDSTEKSYFLISQPNGTYEMMPVIFDSGVGNLKLYYDAGHAVKYDNKIFFVLGRGHNKNVKSGIDVFELRDGYMLSKLKFLPGPSNLRSVSYSDIASVGDYVLANAVDTTNGWRGRHMQVLSIKNTEFDIIRSGFKQSNTKPFPGEIWNDWCFDINFIENSGKLISVCAARSDVYEGRPMLSALNNGVFEPIKINSEFSVGRGNRHRDLHPVINQKETKLVSWDISGERTLKGGTVYEKIAINLINFGAADLASMETTLVESTPAFFCDKTPADYYTSEDKRIEHVAYKNGFTKFTNFDDLPLRLQPCANDITLERYYRKWLSERSKAKYQVLPSVSSKLDFVTRDSDFVKHQLQTNGVLSYLFFDNGSVTYDALPPDGRFDFDLDENTEFRGNSLGKGVVSYLVGHAQCDGHLTSVDANLSSWPLLKNTVYENAKLVDVLDMRARDQHLINKKDSFVKTGRWTNSLSVGGAVEKVLKGTKPNRTSEYNQNSLAANVAMNYLIFELGDEWQPFLNDVFQERVRIQNRIFFQKNGGLDESYGLGTYSMYATRYDYLRIAIAMIEDWQNETCVGEYLRELIARKQPKGKQNWNDSDPKRMRNSFSLAADYAGNFHQSYIGLQKRNIIGLEGYGGQSILVDLDNSRAVVVNAASANYDWYELVYLPIKNGVVRQN